MSKIEMLDLTGQGPRKVRVYECVNKDDYWGSVTDIPCPICSGGVIRWAEAGYVPGYRVCDGRRCGRHFQALAGPIRLALIVGRRGYPQIH